MSEKLELIKKNNVYKESLPVKDPKEYRSNSLLQKTLDPVKVLLVEIKILLDRLSSKMDSPQKVEIINGEKLPEVQKVEVNNFPEQEKIVFPEKQDVEVKNFPDLSILINFIKNFKLPIGEGNNAKSANPEQYVVVRLTDGKRFYKSLDEFYVSTGGGQATNSSQANQSTLTNYAIRLDDTTTANVTYVGKAVIGAQPQENKWQISKIDETTGLIITYADGNDRFDNVWNDRATLQFS